jgi:hypothetical protein
LISQTKTIDVDNKLAMDAVFGNNMEAFPGTDDEDEYCDSDSDGDTEDSDDGSDGSSKHGDDVSATVIDRGYKEEGDLNGEDLAISDDEADLHGDATASFAFASLMNALRDALDDNTEVLNNPVTIVSVVTVESLLGHDLV